MVTGDARIWADLGAEDRGRAMNLAEMSKRDLSKPELALRF